MYHRNSAKPLRLLPKFKERVWGWSDLRSWFSDAPAGVIGEAWFTAPDNRTTDGMELKDLLSAQPELLGDACDPRHPDLCPLLVKLLFTSSRLSVQVHPKDEYAQRHHQCLGKTEAWYVLDAQPGGAVALGLKQQLTPERFRASLESGEIEHYLNWRAVSPGDVIYVPAGTVHAIGAGLTICEIQQNSDITYRLYDYGRPRELHLDHGCNVSDLGPYVSEATRKRISPEREILVECDCFTIEHLNVSASSVEISAKLPHYTLLVSLSGEGTISGAQFSKGQTWFVPAGADPFAIEGNSSWLIAYTGNQNPIPLRTV